MLKACAMLIIVILVGGCSVLGWMGFGAPDLPPDNPVPPGAVRVADDVAPSITLGVEPPGTYYFVETHSGMFAGSMRVERGAIRPIKVSDAL